MAESRYRWVDFDSGRGVATEVNGRPAVLLRTGVEAGPERGRTFYALSIGGHTVASITATSLESAIREAELVVRRYDPTWPAIGNPDVTQKGPAASPSPG